MLDSVISSGRPSRRDAAWFVMTDAAMMTTVRTGRAQLATFLLPLTTIAVNSAATTTIPPEIKKLAPTTPRKPMSAVAIRTAESTYRYKSCTMASPTALKRSSFHDEARTHAILSSEATGDERAVQSTNSTPPSSTDWKTRVPARRTTDRNEKRSTSLTNISPYFTVKGTSPLLMWPSEASTFHCNL